MTAPGNSESTKDEVAPDPQVMDSIKGATQDAVSPEGARRLSFVMGFIAVALAVMAARFLSDQTRLPLMIAAIGIGMIFGPLAHHPLYLRGIDFSASTLLKFAVGLLGLQIAAADIVALGFGPIAVAVGGTLSSIVFALAIGKWLRLGRHQSLLCGAAVGICGASAAIAMATVLPPWRTKDRDVLVVVILVTILSTVAMVAYPAIPWVLEMSPLAGAVFLGASIHDVAQVAGAADIFAPSTLNLAVYTKMLRVALLAPICLLTAIAAAKGRRGVGAKARFPMFLLGFIGCVFVSSTGLLPPTVIALAYDVSKTALVAAVVALGMRSSPAMLFAGKRKLPALILATTVWIGLYSLSAAIWFG